MVAMHIEMTAVHIPAKSMGRSLAMRAKKKADNLYMPEARSLQYHKPQSQSLLAVRVGLEVD